MSSEKDPRPPFPEAFGQSFRRLKSVCDRIALEPSRKENASDLSQVLENVEDFIVQKLQNYLLVPLIVHLSNKKSNRKDTVISVLECLRVLLKRLVISEEAAFWEIFVMTWLQVRDSEDPSRMNCSPEELKLLVVDCIQLLIENAPISLQKLVYKREYQPKFSLAVYTCVEMAKTEKCILLRVESLKCIACMMKLNSTNDDLRKQVADVAMLMLPGIASCCGHIVSSSVTQNHKVIAEAVRLWGQLVSLILEDAGPTDDEPRVFKLGSPALPETTEFKFSKDNRRDDDKWLKKTGHNLVPITLSMERLSGHHHWFVRKELAVQIDAILSRASRHMTPSLRSLLDTLIILSQDEDERVARQSASSLAAFSRKCDRKTGKGLAEIAENCFYNLLTHSPRIFHGADLNLKEKQLILLSGYLDILGPENLSIILRSHNHLSRLLHSLYIASTLDTSDVSLSAEHAVREFDDGLDSTDCPWRKLKLCCTSKCDRALTDICTKLVSGHLNVINSLLDDFDCKAHHRKEILLLLNRMLVTVRAGTSYENESLLKQILIAVMEPKLWCSPVEGGLCTDIQESQSNVVLVCLLTEVVASLAWSLGPETFTPLLLRCLYPVLECAGSPLYILSSAGLKSVNRIAALYGGHVSDLVAANVDYLSYHVTKNLRHAQTNPKVLAVLSVIMKHSNFGTLPSIYEIINDVLVRSCDAFQNISANSFLSVFLTFFNCLVDWIEVEQPSTTIPTPPRKSIVQELLEYDKNLIEESSDVIGSENSEENYKELIEESEKAVQNESTDVYDDKAPVPDHINLTVQILERSLHFLPSKVISRQILVLQVLEKGALILSKWPNQLLPLVHKMWSPLVERFSVSSDPVIMRRAFELLEVLGSTSKDFIRVRTVKEVLPSICRFLRNEQLNALRKGRGDLNHFKMSQTYKFLIRLMNGLPRLCIDLDVIGEPLGRIVERIIPYLSSYEPQTLQDASRAALETIASKDADLVWGYLLSECPVGNELVPPDERCRTYKFAVDLMSDDSKKNENLKDNVSKLLNTI